MEVFMSYLEVLAKDWWFVALLMIGAGLAVSANSFGKKFREERFKLTVYFLACAMIVLNLLAALIYLFLPQYWSHVEPTVVITALNAYQGLPIHPDWSRGEGAYGGAYGPFLYAVAGLPLLASKSVVASKLATFAAFLFALTAMWRQGGRSSTWFQQLTVAFYLLAIVAFSQYAVWLHPEPLLLALAAAGVIAVQIRRDTLRWLALGALAGLASALKIHGAIYFVPLGMFALVRAPHAKQAALWLATAAVGFVVALVAAYGADPHEAVNSWKYLTISIRQGFETNKVIQNVVTALVLTTPYGIALWRVRASLSQDWRTVLTAGAAAGAVAMVILVASKPGAGWHHLMPFIPVMLFLTLTLGTSKATDAYDPSPILAGAMIVAALAPLAAFCTFLVQELWGARDTVAAYREAKDLALRYPGAQFGPTDTDHYLLLRDRVGAALGGAKLTFDLMAWMDLDFAGIQPSDDAADFSPGPSVWILPRDGAPFSMHSYYNKTAPMFSPAIQANFLSHCHQIDVRTTFAAWRCESGLL